MSSPLKTYGGKIYMAENGFMPKTLSFSGMNMYMNCPRDYYHQYVLGLWNNEWGLAFCFGHTMHKMLETHLKTHGDQSDVEMAMESAFLSEGLYENVKDEKEQKKIKAMAWGMYQDNIKHLVQFEPRELEHKFEVPIRNPDRPDEVLPVRLRGIIDMIAKPLIVVDHKTAASFKEEIDYVSDAQPYLYAMACKEIYGEYPSKVVFNVLLKRKRDFSTKVVEMDFDPDRLAYAYREVVNVIQGMLLGEWQKGGKKHFWTCYTCKTQK